MPNIKFYGIPQETAEKIIDHLMDTLTNDFMKEVVYSIHPDAPVLAITKEPAPYIRIDSSDGFMSTTIRHKLKEKFGEFDVEIATIIFYPGSNTQTSDDVTSSQ